MLSHKLQKVVAETERDVDREIQRRRRDDARLLTEMLTAARVARECYADEPDDLARLLAPIDRMLACFEEQRERLEATCEQLRAVIKPAVS